MSCRCAHRPVREQQQVLPKLKQEHARTHYMTGAPDPRHEPMTMPMTDRDRTPRGPPDRRTTTRHSTTGEGRGAHPGCHTGTLKCTHGSSRHRRGVMGGGCELHISKVLTALRHHVDTPRHLHRGTVSESKMPSDVHTATGVIIRHPRHRAGAHTHTGAVSTSSEPLDPLTRNSISRRASR